MSYLGFIAQDSLGPDLGSSSMGQFSFTVGGAAYAFITNPTGITTSCKIAVYKSTDLGQTWTAVGAGSSPAIPIVVGSSSPMWTVARDGSSAIAVWAEMEHDTSFPPWTVAHVGKAVFSFSSDSWGAAVQIANPGLDIWQDRLFSYPASDGREYTALQLIVRGPGDYILFYQGTCNTLSGPPSVSRQARVSYSTFNGSTFGPEVQLPGQTATYFYFIYGGCADPSGLITFLYTRELWPNVPASGPITMSCSLSAGNALGTPVDITPGVYDGEMFRRAMSTPVAYTAGGSAHVAFAAWTTEGGSNTGVRVFDAVSTASPSWTSSLVTNDQTIQPVFPDIPYAYPYLISAMSDGSKLVVVWAQSTFVDALQAAYYYSSTPVGGAFSWTTPSPLWVPPVLDGSPSEASQVNVFLTTGGFGVVGVSTSTHFDPGSVAVQSSFISSSGGLISISCNAPPSGALGDAYSHSLIVTGAPAGSTTAITSGALPPGLVLDSSGVITGTPTSAGTFPFTVTVSPPASRSIRSGSVINLPGQGLGWDFRQCPNAPIPGALGGYEYSGVQYLFLLQGSEFGVGDFKLHALKSTDLGVTWTDTGNISIPNNAGTGLGLPTYTTCMDGSTVHVMGVDLVGAGETVSFPNTGPILLFSYNLASNTFGSGATPGGAPIVSKGWDGTTYPPRSGICLHLLRRGPGDMLLLYTGVETIGANKYSRIYVATFNGTSCGAGVVLSGQVGAPTPYIERCACIDGSGNLHVILSSNDFHFWYHIAMSPAGSFGTFQTIETNAYYLNDTSNLLDYSAPADTIAFLGIRNRSSSGANGDLAIYSALGGSLSPSWTFHNLPSTVNAVQDPRIAPDWISSLGFLDGTLHAFWTQTGVSPSWSVSAGMGEIRTSTAAATDLATWTAETSVMGPFDSGGAHWGAGQVGVWSGTGIGLGVLGNFEGYDDAGTGNPIESSHLVVFPPAGGGGGPASVACSITTGYGTLSTSCGSPPVMTVGQGARYRPPVVMGTIGLPPVYDQDGTLVWTFPTVVPPGFHWETNPASPNYGYLVGVPEQSGVQGFTYTVTSPDSQTVTNTCPLTVEPANGGGGGGGSGSITIFCGDPPGGTVGVPYNHTLPVVGATGPTVYSVVVGALPPGVTLDPATGDLSGTPTAPGTYSFSVKVQQ